MTRIEWGKVGDRTFEVGVDRGVFYPQTGPGVPWSGLVNVTSQSSGGEIEPIYFEGVKVADIVLSSDFEGSIEALSCPIEFLKCQGSVELVPGLFATHQPRERFGFAYRSLIGNDVDGVEHAYKLHLLYNLTAGSNGQQASTLNEKLTPETQEWPITAVPPAATTYKPTAHLIFDSRRIDPYQLQDIEDYLYGTDILTPQLPSQAQILEMLANVITEPIGATI